jgi:hypothetical protein
MFIGAFFCAVFLADQRISSVLILAFPSIPIHFSPFFPAIMPPIGAKKCAVFCKNRRIFGQPLLVISSY